MNKQEYAQSLQKYERRVKPIPNTKNHMNQFMCKYSQVLEYRPGTNEWVDIGNLQISRYLQGVAAIGIQQLPCLTG